MEWLNAYDKEGNLIGKVERQHAHSKEVGVFHKAVWIWFINSKGEVLVQKRSKFKKQSPSKWDFPSAGHVDFGENLISTCLRETEEELGLKIPEKDFEFLFTTFKPQGWEFGETYLVKADILVEEIKIQEEEVEEVKWLSFEDFKTLLYSDDFCAHAKEYKDKICDILISAKSNENQTNSAKSKLE